MTLTGRVEVKGNVHLIAANGANLVTDYGITVSKGNKIQIHGQNANADSDGIVDIRNRQQYSLNAALGAASDSNGGAGTIIIHGGLIRALQGSAGGAAIGGAGSPNAATTEGVTIYDGRVYGQSNKGGSAFGGGNCGTAPLHIYGGIVMAAATGNVKQQHVLNTGTLNNCTNPVTPIEPDVDTAKSLVFSRNSTAQTDSLFLGGWLDSKPEEFTVPQERMSIFTNFFPNLEVRDTKLVIGDNKQLRVKWKLDIGKGGNITVNKGGFLYTGGTALRATGTSQTPAAFVVDGIVRSTGREGGFVKSDTNATIDTLDADTPSLSKTLPETGTIELKPNVVDSNGFRAGSTPEWGDKWFKVQYSIDENGAVNSSQGWQDSTTFTNVKPGVHKFYARYYAGEGNFSYLAYGKSLPLENVELAPAKPQATPNYQDDKLTITNYDAQKVTTYQVCEDPDCTQPKTVTVNSDGTISNMSEVFGLTGDESKTVYLRSITDDGVPSDVQKITFAARPAAPTELSAQNTTTYGGQDGHITGQTDGKSYEYYNPATTRWEPLTAETGLSAGDYQVRYAGSATALPSEATTLTVKDPAPTGTVNFPLEKITLNPTAAPAGMQYVACLNADCTETKAISPDSSGNIALSEFGNVPGAVNTTIRFALADANDPSKLLSEVGSAVVPPRPAAPTELKGNAPSTVTGTDGTISGMQDNQAYEYLDENTGQWKPLTSDVQLPAGSYSVRFAATTTAPASQPATVQIPYGAPTLTPVTTDETLTIAPAEAPNGTHYVICEDASCSKSKTVTVDPQNSSIKLSEFGALPGTTDATVYVALADDDGKIVSTVGDAVIKARPAAPEVSGSPTSTATSEDGKVTGLKEGVAYEYQDATGKWVALTSDTELPAGNYKVRLAATESDYASAPADVTIGLGGPAVTLDNASETVSVEPATAPSGQHYAICANDDCTETTPVKVENGKIAYSEFGAPADTDITKKLVLADEDGKPVTGATPVTIPARPAAPTDLTGAPTSAPGASDGKITGLKDGVAYEYQDATGKWVALTSDTELPAGNYKVRLAATEDAPASQPATVQVLDGAPTVTVDNKTETVTVSPAEAPAGTSYAVCANADCTETKPVTVTDGKIPFSELGAPADTDIDKQIVLVDEDGKPVSKPAPVHIAAIPAAPTDLTGAPTSEPGASDGKITGLKEGVAYEYQDATGKWVALTSDTELPAGEYKVRLAATEDAPASQPATVQVLDGAPTATVDNKTETVKVEPAPAPEGSSYVICLDANCTKTKPVTVGPDGTIPASEFGAPGDKPITGWIALADKDGKVTSEAAPVTFPARPAAPAGLNGVAPTTAGGSDGKITGLKDGVAYEYQDATGKWVALTSNTKLPAGEYKVRLAATEDAPASQPVTVKVPEYVAPAGAKGGLATTGAADFMPLTLGAGALLAAGGVLLIARKRRNATED